MAQVGVATGADSCLRPEQARKVHTGRQQEQFDFLVHFFGVRLQYLDLF